MADASEGIVPQPEDDRAVVSRSTANATPADIARRFLYAMHTGTEEVGDLVTRAVVVIDVDASGQESRQTYEDLISGAAMSQAAFPGLNLTIEDERNDGSSSSITYTLRGHHTGSLGPLPPTHKYIELRITDVVLVQDGLVVSVNSTEHPPGLRDQLGLHTTYPAEARGPIGNQKLIAQIRTQTSGRAPTHAACMVTAPGAGTAEWDSFWLDSVLPGGVLVSAVSMGIMAKVLKGSARKKSGIEDSVTDKMAVVLGPQTVSIWQIGRKTLSLVSKIRELSYDEIVVEVRPSGAGTVRLTLSDASGRTVRLDGKTGRNGAPEVFALLKQRATGRHASQSAEILGKA